MTMTDSGCSLFIPRRNSCGSITFVFFWRLCAENGGTARFRVGCVYEWADLLHLLHSTWSTNCCVCVISKLIRPTTYIENVNRQRINLSAFMHISIFTKYFVDLFSFVLTRWSVGIQISRIFVMKCDCYCYWSSADVVFRWHGASDASAQHNLQTNRIHNNRRVESIWPESAVHSTFVVLHK